MLWSGSLNSIASNGYEFASREWIEQHEISAHAWVRGYPQILEILKTLTESLRFRARCC
jgi:hypothetical protein